MSAARPISTAVHGPEEQPVSNIHEQPVVIRGTLPTPMLGILTAPAKDCQPTGTGVVIVNGGAQYRAGAHRLFVQLARQLAMQGHAVLRFDFPGQGDSPGHRIGFEDTAMHIGAAIDMLGQYHPQLNKTGLLGLCDGASAGLLYLHQRPDRRVTHLALLNPWVRNEVSAARAQLKHYYRDRLSTPHFWRRLLSGQVGWASIAELLEKISLSRLKLNAATGRGFQQKMLEALVAHHGPIALVLSGEDLVAKEFQELVQADNHWRDCIEKRTVTLTEMDSADHTFCRPAEQTMRQLNTLLTNWINS